MSFKPLFSRSLGAAPNRLHFAAHSHHLWPDASFTGHSAAWEDAATLADRKWDKVMGPTWAEAQGHVASELATGMPDAIAFSPNTHDLLLRLISACPRSGERLSILTSDGEFHSARRQFVRWVEEGTIALETIPCEPFETFSRRFLDRATERAHDLYFVSQVMFSSGLVFEPVETLAAIADPAGPWVAIDGYHSFMAIADPLGAAAASSAFFLGGGYKYAMAGEGCAFLHAPPGFGPRPPLTGWFAEFEDLTLPPGQIGYAPDGRRFLGATFDPTALYRFNAVRRMLAENGLDTAHISALTSRFQRRLLEEIGGTGLAEATLTNPPADNGAHARFLAFRSPQAGSWGRALLDRNCVTDVRGDVLRIGFGLYHDEDDVDALIGLLKDLQ